MITKLSIIFTIVLSISSFILFCVLDVPVVYGILFSISIFIFILGCFAVIMMLLLYYKGKHYATIYDPKDKKRWNLMNDTSRFITFWLNIKIRVNGLEKLELGNTYVFYSNHQSFLDMFVYDIVLKDFPRGSMYKKEHETNPLISGMVKGLGGISIDRNDDRSAIKSVINIIKEVDKGVNFMIYPEGTRSKKQTMNNYHAGCFKISQKSNSKLVILSIDGAYKWTRVVPFIRTNVYVNVIDVYDKEYCQSMSSVELCKEVFEKTKTSIECHTK